MPAPVTLIAQDGDTLDDLAWREARLGPDALVPLFKANPRLCEKTVLSAGDRVTIPPALLSNPAPSRTIARVQLWD